MYTVTAKFINNPDKIIQTQDSRNADAAALHFIKNFAAIKAVMIKEPDGKKRVYDRNGNHVWTIPA